MTKRPLTKEEKTIYLKKIPKLKDNINTLETDIKINEFKRDTMLDFSYKKQKGELTKAVKEAEMTLKTVTETHKVMDQHLRDGVEIKKKTKKDKEVK